MRAVYIDKLGSLDDLEVRYVPDPPPPGENEVLVRVQAAGLNRADLLQVRGHYPPPQGYSPNIPGLEFAGEIALIGDGVNGWSIGDRVFGITAGEAQAEYLLSDHSLLTRIPDPLSFAEAAAVPEAFITAHDALFIQDELARGETLLIHAVGSGVGLAALQLAKAKGAFVIGTSRTADKLERCKEFGLDAAILTGPGTDLKQEIDRHTSGKGVDVVLDLVGAANFEANLASLATKGRLVLVGLTSGATAELNMGLVLAKRAKMIGTVLRARPLEEKAEATQKFAAEVVPLIASRAVKPVLDRVFAPEDVIDAYKYLASNESFGKVVIQF